MSESTELRQRFEQEARAISKLNHPHICTLYDVGREGAVDFLVMELLEGESLAERLRKGRLPFEEALRYAIQVADALASAHRQGIVHRDLKPGNIILMEKRPEGSSSRPVTRLRVVLNFFEELERRAPETNN